MFDWTKKKLEQLLDTLVDLLWKWVLTLPWAIRLALFVFCVATFAAGLHWKDAQRYLATGVRIVSVTLHSGHDIFPLSDKYHTRVREGIARLAASLEANLASRLARSSQPEYGTWVPAQLAVALNGISLPQPIAIFTRVYGTDNGHARRFSAR